MNSANVTDRHHKVGCVLWTIDPSGNKRFLLRHNRPFDGYEDEWTICFGNIENGEDSTVAAKREAEEEFSVHGYEEIRDLGYAIEYEGKYSPTVIHFFALRVPTIDTPIHLNEESIGYDWMTLSEAKERMLHADELKALELS